MQLKSLLRLNKKRSSSISPAIEEQWRQDGLVLLPGAVPDNVVNMLNDELARHTGPERLTLDMKTTVDVLHGAYAGQLLRLCEAPDEVFAGPVKVNNLFAESAGTRFGTFHQETIETMTGLLGEPPVAINSLNFCYGSQQPAHIDSWYMPPPKADRLIVASIYCDEVEADNGPLFYYPGSHRIKPYPFSHGRLDAVPEEMDQCNAYFAEQLERLEIVKKTILAKPGDVVLWHCHLMHGGSVIRDPAKTRRSLVTHYWGKSCLRSRQLGEFLPGQYFLDRDYSTIN